MDTAPGWRAALTMMGLGSGAGAAGLAALHGGVASAAEASLLPPRGNIAERAHRSPEQDTAAPGLQADSIPVYRQRRRADSCGNVQPSLERLHLENTAILSAFTALPSNLVSSVPAVLALKPFVAPLADPQRAWLVIAMASTLAGNFTLLASVANLIVVQRASTEGIEVNFWSHFRIGAPLMIATIVSGVLIL